MVRVRDMYDRGIASLDHDLSLHPKDDGHVSATSIEQPLEQRSEQSQSRGFRPFAHRTAPLIVLGGVILAAVGALEYGLHALPQVSYSAQDGPIGTGASAVDLPKLRRGVDACATNSSGPRAATLSPCSAAATSSTSVSGSPTNNLTRTSETPEASPASTAFGGNNITTIRVSYPATPANEPGAASTDTPSSASAASSDYQGTAAKTIKVSAPTPSNDQLPQPPASAPQSSYRGQSANTIILSKPRTSTSRPSLFSPTVASDAYKGESATNRAGLKSTTRGDPTKTTQVDSKSTSPAPISSTKSSAGVLVPDVIESGMPLKWVKDNYFLGVYCPVLLAIGLRVLVDYVYRSTRLVSPFYMLSRKHGSSIDNLLSANHLGSGSIVAPYRAVEQQNWILVWASSLYAAAQVITVLASELISVRYAEDRSGIRTESQIVQAYALCINTALARTIQGLLLFTFLLLISIWYLARRNTCTLPGSPASIAVIASLFGRRETGNDVLHARSRGIGTALDTSSDLRYHLRHYTDHQGNQCYGIISDAPTNPKRDYDGFTMSMGRPVSSIYELYPVPHVSRWRRHFGGCKTLSVLSITAVVLFGVILAYTINGDATSFELFMDSQEFGPRFLLSVLGMMVKSPLVSIRARAVAEIPFRRLTSPRPGTMDLQAPVPLTALGSIPYAIRRYEWYVGSLAVAAGLLIELLLVLLPGVPFQAQQSFLAAQISWYGSLACLGLILLVAVVGWVRLYSSSEIGSWPRRPTTIGAVANYVSCTKMAADCAIQLRPQMNDAKYVFCMADGRWRIDYADTTHVDAYLR